MNALSTREYLQSKEIGYDALPNGHYAIALSDFTSLFSSNEQEEILTAIAYDIDALFIDNKKITDIEKISPKYLRTIQQLWITKNHLIMPSPDFDWTSDFKKELDAHALCDMDKIHRLFSNVTQVYGVHVSQVMSITTCCQRSLSYGQALRASLLARQGNYEGAERTEREALENDNESPFALTESAILGLRRGLSQQAVDCARQAIQYHPTYSKAHEVLARALFFRGMKEDARESLETILALNPKSTFARAAHATLLTAEGRLDEAEEMIHQALELDPEYAPAYMEMGKVFGKRNEWKRANSALMKAIYMDPRLTRAYELHEEIQNILAQLTL
ncbi:MAG: tetratricopeptide repeat protein [Verrucomicrobia bacterium]|nr:tetratricopeptide repeat protein [Verrucomicrobiota bacterium]